MSMMFRNSDQKLEKELAADDSGRIRCATGWRCWLWR